VGGQLTLRDWEIVGVAGERGRRVALDVEGISEGGKK
jgi:hypothetical protein